MQVLFHMLITKNIFTLHAMRASAPKPLRGLLISCPPVNLAGEVLVPVKSTSESQETIYILGIRIRHLECAPGCLDNPEAAPAVQ